MIAVQRVPATARLRRVGSGLLEAIANQAAIALENARLYGEAQRGGRRLRVVVLQQARHPIVVIDRDWPMSCRGPAAALTRALDLDTTQETKLDHPATACTELVARRSVMPLEEAPV